MTCEPVLVTSKVSVPAGRLGGRDLALVVGRLDAERPRVAAVGGAVVAVGVLGARGEERALRPARAADDEGRAHGRGSLVESAGRASAGGGRAGWAGRPSGDVRASEEEGHHRDRRRGATRPPRAWWWPGEKLKMPLSRVPYQLLTSMVSETSKARLLRPGRKPASWRSWTP